MLQISTCKDAEKIICNKRKKPTVKKNGGRMK